MGWRLRLRELKKWCSGLLTLCFIHMQTAHPYKYVGENVDLQGLNVFKVCQTVNWQLCLPVFMCSGFYMCDSLSTMRLQLYAIESFVFHPWHLDQANQAMVIVFVNGCLRPFRIQLQVVN